MYVLLRSSRKNMDYIFESALYTTCCLFQACTVEATVGHAGDKG